MDIDLLVVYRDADTLKQLIDEFDALEFAALLDVTAMTPDELEQSGFASRSGMVPL